MSAEKHDIDPIETQEWLDALSSVLENEGSERAHFILENLVRYTRRRGVHLPFSATTAYLNTIPVGKEQKSPGNHELEHRIRAAIRWNAAAMVLRAGKKDLELGGHIASSNLPPLCMTWASTTFGALKTKPPAKKAI